MSRLTSRQTASISRAVFLIQTIRVHSCKHLHRWESKHISYPLFGRLWAKSVLDLTSNSKSIGLEADASGWASSSFHHWYNPPVQPTRVPFIRRTYRELWRFFILVRFEPNLLPTRGRSSLNACPFSRLTACPAAYMPSRLCTSARTMASVCPSSGISEMLHRLFRPDGFTGIALDESTPTPVIAFETGEPPSASHGSVSTLPCHPGSSFIQVEVTER